MENCFKGSCNKVFVKFDFPGALTLGEGHVLDRLQRLSLKKQTLTATMGAEGDRFQTDYFDDVCSG